MIYLFSAYSIIWIIIFFFTVNISTRQRQLEKEVESLQMAVNKVTGKQ